MTTSGITICLGTTGAAWEESSGLPEIPTRRSPTRVSQILCCGGAEELGLSPCPFSVECLFSAGMI